MRVLSKAPDFSLSGVDGNTVSLSSFLGSHAAVAVIFTCNHCPYAMAYEERLMQFQSRYLPKGIALVAINPDNEAVHPEDTFENMKRRAAEKKFTFPYLRDQYGEVAKAYGITTMPEAVLVDAGGAIRYAGRIDDCWQNAKRVKRHDLREAIEDILHGRDVAVKTTQPIGCAIRWSDAGQTE